MNTDEAFGTNANDSSDMKDQSVSELLNAAQNLKWDYPDESAILNGKAAVVGSTSGMIAFGLQVQNLDPDLASYWFEQAAKAGNTDAFGYFIELWTEKDQCRATDLVDQIMATEDPELIYESATQLKDVNINIAISMLEKATGLGDPHAPHELGKLLLKKTTKNRDKAMCLFDQAAKQGNSFALIDLAEMIQDQEPSRAADMYEQALKGTGDGYAHDYPAAKLAWLVKDTDPERALAPFEAMMQSISIEAKNDYANAIDSIDHEKAEALYHDALVVETEDLGFVYCGIPTKRSGLPVRLMASDEGCCNNNGYNPPHVLVANTADKHNNIIGGDSFKASISKDPKVLEGNNKLSDEDWSSVRAFIAKNYDALMDHWINAEETGSLDLYESLFPEACEESLKKENQRINEALRLIDPGESLDMLIDSMWEHIKAESKE